MPNPFAIAADLLAPERRFTDDPAGWVEATLAERLWSKQAEVSISVRDHRRTAVPSCHEAGKSFLAARLTCWWIATHDPGEAFVVTTAPSFQQVRAILWREINRAHRKAALPGHTNQTEWHLNGELVAFGRKPEDTEPAGFQGIHQRYVLVIIDEACGVPKALWDAADSLIANEGGRILAIGNPDDPISYFADVCKPGSGWNVIAIDGLQTPNVTGEAVPDDVRPLLISPLWIEEKRKSWGEESPLYQSKVRGRFPELADDGVVPYTWARRCQTQRQEPGAPVELGVDVGGGGDFTVIRERRGPRVGRVWRDHSADPMQVVGKVIRAIDETKATAVKVDTIGIGWGVAGRLEELRREGRHQARITRVNVGEASSDPKRFPRLRDQIWWEVGRELSETGGWDLGDLDDDTIAQLIAPKYGIDSSGRVKVEPKDDTRQRIGRSPDDADALLLAFFHPQPSMSGLLELVREQAGDGK